MNPMYITFGLYLIAVLLIGLAAYFSTRDFGDYILGGRSLGGGFGYVWLAADGVARGDLSERFERGLDCHRLGGRCVFQLAFGGGPSARAYRICQ